MGTPSPIVPFVEKKTILLFLTITLSAEGKYGTKPFFPLSPECQDYCEKEGLKVDFVESKIESKCDCYPE
jgi:hypothetical protein